MSSLMDLLLNGPSAQDRYMQVQQLQSMMQPSLADQLAPAGDMPTPDMTGTNTENPWGVDPNGMDLVTRHGVTLDRDVMQALIQARRNGYNVFPYIGQGYRSIADSNALYNQRHDANGNLLPGVLPAAKGGQSMHNYGLAFDAGGLPQRIREYLLANGFYWGAEFGDEPHFSYYRLG